MGRVRCSPLSRQRPCVSGWADHEYCPFPCPDPQAVSPVPLQEGNHNLAENGSGRGISGIPSLPSQSRDDFLARAAGGH